MTTHPAEPPAIGISIGIGIGLPGRIGATLLALGMTVLTSAGCQGRGATGGCSAAGSECGGNPIGVWQVVATCGFPAFSRPAQNYDTSRGYFAPETGAAPPATTSGPWCFDLAFDKDGTVISPTAPMPNPDFVVSGTVEFDAGPDYSYLYALTASSTTSFHVARSCLGVNGANLTCLALADKLTATIGANPVYANAAGTPPFRCHDGGDGCDCQFDYIETQQNAVGDKGTWAQDGNVLHHYSITGQGNLFETSPSRRTVRDAVFCQMGDTMQLTGANGQPLALKTGARALTLTRIGSTGAGGESGGAGGGVGGAAGESGAGGAGGGVAGASDDAGAPAADAVAD